VVSASLDERRRLLYSAQHSAADIINDAGLITSESRTRLAGVRADWEADKAAVAPFSNTAEGQAALALAGQKRLAEAGGVVQEAVYASTTLRVAFGWSPQIFPGRDRAHELPTSKPSTTTGNKTRRYPHIRLTR
jgi:hypothetical protein